MALDQHTGHTAFRVGIGWGVFALPPLETVVMHLARCLCLLIALTALQPLADFFCIFIKHRSRARPAFALFNLL